MGLFGRRKAKKEAELAEQKRKDMIKYFEKRILNCDSAYDYDTLTNIKKEMVNYFGGENKIPYGLKYSWDDQRRICATLGVAQTKRQLAAETERQKQYVEEKLKVRDEYQRTGKIRKGWAIIEHDDPERGRVD